MNEPQRPPTFPRWVRQIRPDTPGAPPSANHRPQRRTLRPRAVGSLLVAACTLLLAGCGQGVQPAPNTATAGFGTGAKGTVTVWVRAATQTSDQQMADAFNRTHHGVHVEIAVVPDTQFVTKIATAIRSGNVPDAVDLDDVNSTLLAYHNALTDLTPLIHQLPFANQLSPGHLDLATVSGHTYAVPFAADVSVLFYNKTLFRKAGLNPNDPPHNYTQILADARKINALGDGIKGVTVPGQEAGILGFTGFPGVWSAGGHLLKGPLGHQTATIAGNKPLADMLGFYHTLWQEKLVPQAAQTETAATYGQDFLAGKIGMMPGSFGMVEPNAAPGFLKQVGAVPLSGAAGQPGAFPGGDDIAIPRGSHNASGAWEFIQFALQAKQQASLPKSGFTPVRADVATPAWRRANPLDAVSLDALRHAGMDKTIAYNVLINQVSGPFLALFSKTVFGDADIDSALRSSQHSFEQTLDDSQT